MNQKTWQYYYFNFPGNLGKGKIRKSKNKSDIHHPISDTVLAQRRGGYIVQIRYNHRYFEPDHRRSNTHRRRVNIERKGEGKKSSR